MDFWVIGPRLTIHKSFLVALVLDINNWRPGEIASIEGLDSEGRCRINLDLSFHDSHRHREVISNSDRDPIRIYYRYPYAINGNPAEHKMVEEGRGFKELTRDYQSLRFQNPYDERVQHLSIDLLDMQYKLTFGENCPRINQNSF